MLYSTQINPLRAANVTHNSIVGLTVPPGASVWPHLLDVIGPAPLVNGSIVLASLHLVDENGQPSFGVSIAGIDNTNVNLQNSLGVPQDVKIEVVLLHPHYGLDGSLVPAMKNWDLDQSVLAPGGNGPAGPFGLTDDLAVTLVPLAVGHAPENGPYWNRISDPPLDGNPTVFNDNGGGGLTINHTGTVFHSPQRVGPGADPQNRLYRWIPPQTIVHGGAFADFDPSLEVAGAPVLPDISWPVVIGSTGAGVPLAAPTFLRLDAYVPNQIRYKNLNPNPGESVTLYVCSLYLHSAVRVP